MKAHSYARGSPLKAARRVTSGNRRARAGAGLLVCCAAAIQAWSQDRESWGSAKIESQPNIVIGETKDRLRLVIDENVGGGKSWKKHLVSEGRESHKGANAVDLDGDSDLDLVSIAYFGFKDLHVWRNDNGGAAAVRN